MSHAKADAMQTQASCLFGIARPPSLCGGVFVVRFLRHSFGSRPFGPCQRYDDDVDDVFTTAMTTMTRTKRITTRLPIASLFLFLPLTLQPPSRPLRWNCKCLGAEVLQKSRRVHLGGQHAGKALRLRVP